MTFVACDVGLDHFKPETATFPKLRTYVDKHLLDRKSHRSQGKSCPRTKFEGVESTPSLGFRRLSYARKADKKENDKVNNTLLQVTDNVHRT